MSAPPPLPTPPPLPIAPRQRKVALVLGITALLLLAAFFTYLELTPRWAEAKTQMQQQSTLLSARNNLVQISATADTYFVQHPTKETVTVPELKSWLPGVLRLQPVENEDYDAIVITKNYERLTITLPSGVVVEWRRR